MEMWRVDHTTPNYTGRWRTIARGHEDDMRTSFDAACAALRRGHVRLIRPPGELVLLRSIGLQTHKRPDTQTSVSGR